MPEDIAVNESLESLTTSLQSERKWRNVQTVLPECFGLVARVLKDQAQVIQQLQHRIDGLERVQVTAVNSDLITALEERVRLDMKRRVARFRKEVSVSLEQQQAVMQNVKEESKSKALHQEEAVAKKCLQVEQSLEQLRCKVEEGMDQLTASTKDRLKSLELQFKSTRIQDADRLAKMRQEMTLKVVALEHKLIEVESRREAVNVPDVKKVAPTSPESREGNEDPIREDLACISQDIREMEIRMEKKLAGWRQELLASISKKFCKSEVTKLLSRKMDAMDAWKQLAEKADSARVDEVTNALMDSIQRAQETMIGDVDQLRQLNEAKADALELVQVKHNMHNLLSVAESIQYELSALQRVMNEKMTIADVKELLASQSTLNGLQNAMKQVDSAAAGEFAAKCQVDIIDRQGFIICKQPFSPTTLQPFKC
ncbi:Pectate lyase [Phytophthora cinnamomi]|uniref:Pectate lyase n=1 Tax=Phytophthora cinnamomi TaxID=4785 RepID=UPI00355982BD|nr:Pectate lyase [Phytophthora cinnamomi]